ncbi:MAG: hypothetical protein ACYDH5_09330 [Acidimicrobiales bacterium]
MSSVALPVHIGPFCFDHADYDEPGDVLYLHIGPFAAHYDVIDTPEGHFVRIDETGRVAGLTVMGARRLLARDGRFTVTLPSLTLPSFAVTADDLAPLLPAAG